MSLIGRMGSYYSFVVLGMPQVDNSNNDDREEKEEERGNSLNDTKKYGRIFFICVALLYLIAFIFLYRYFDPR